MYYGWDSEVEEAAVIFRSEGERVEKNKEWAFSPRTGFLSLRLSDWPPAYSGGSFTWEKCRIRESWNVLWATHQCVSALAFRDEWSCFASFPLVLLLLHRREIQGLFLKVASLASDGRPSRVITSQVTFKLLRMFSSTHLFQFEKVFDTPSLISPE